jgi:hypothetical protein
MQADTYVFSVIRTHDPSVRARGDSSRLRPRGRCDRQLRYHSIKQGYINYRGPVSCGSNICVYMRTFKIWINHDLRISWKASAKANIYNQNTLFFIGTWLKWKVRSRMDFSY